MTCGDSLLNLLDLCLQLMFILIFDKLSVNRNLATLVVRGCQYRINIKTAGPSLQGNLRSELYFAGCKKLRKEIHAEAVLIMNYGNENKVLMYRFNLSSID